jgi:hypothetical protein
MVTTEEIIIRLKPEVDPQSYFGAEWPRVRPLSETTDQFILTVPNATANQVLAEVR